MQKKKKKKTLRGYEVVAIKKLSGVTLDVDEAEQKAIVAEFEG
jgi:hypothetical protein